MSIAVYQFVMQDEAFDYCGRRAICTGDQWIVYTDFPDVNTREKLITVVRKAVEAANALYGPEPDKDTVVDYMIEELSDAGFYTPSLGSLIEMPLDYVIPPED